MKTPSTAAMRDILDAQGFNLRFEKEHRNELAGLLGGEGYVQGLELMVNSWCAFAEVVPSRRSGGGKARLRKALDAVRRAVDDLDAALDADGGGARLALSMHMAVSGPHRIDPRGDWQGAILASIDAGQVAEKLPFEAAIGSLRESAQHLLDLDGWGGRPDEGLRDELVFLAVTQLAGCGVNLSTRSEGTGHDETPAVRVVRACLNLAGRRARWLTVPKDLRDPIEAARARFEAGGKPPSK